MKCINCGEETEITENEDGKVVVSCDNCDISAEGDNMFDAIDAFDEKAGGRGTLAVGVVRSVVMLAEDQEEDIEMAIEMLHPQDVRGVVAVVRTDLDKQSPVGYYAVLRGEVADQLLDAAVKGVDATFEGGD